jgi:Flp pilus assembly protein TadD
MRVLLLLLPLLAACSTVPGTQPSASNQTNLPLAEAAMVAGAPENALHASQAILEGSPKDVNALGSRGDALIAMGRNDEAADSYNRALAVAPNSSPALLGIGRTRLLAGKAAEAEVAFNSAVDANRSDARARSTTSASPAICRASTR